LLIQTYKQVDLLYALFLGRLPENNFVKEDSLGREVVAHARAAIASDEFKKSVLERFLLHRKLPHHELSLRLLPDVLGLMAEAGLAPPGLGHSAAGWKSALGRVLGVPPCRPMVEEIYGAEGRQLIEELIPTDTPPPDRSRERTPGQRPVPSRDIVSGVEIVANTICRGWLIDPAAPEAPSHIRVKLNGATVKIAAADEFRRDVQELYGGKGHAGFTIQLDRLPDIGQLSHATIEITELSRGGVILPEYVVEFTSAPSVKIEAELREELASLRARVEHLQTRIPDDVARRWKAPLVAPLRGERMQAIADDMAAIKEQLGEALKSLSRLEQDFPKLINTTRWPLSYYGALQSQLQLTISPPRVDNPAHFSIFIMADAERPDATAATLESVLEQSLKPTQILLILPSDASPDVMSRDPSVRAVQLKPGQPPFEAVNQAADTASGSHIIILSAGDILKPEMLAWLAHAITQTGGSVIYTDGEIVTVEQGGRRRVRPKFLPTFDYDLLLQRNYIGEIFCADREFYRSLGGFTSDPELEPRHDFLLRATAAAERRGFVHLPQLLYSSVESPACVAPVRTIQRHLDLLGTSAQAHPHNDPIGRSLPDAAKITWPVPSAQKISVIVPTRDRADMVFSLVSSMRRHATAWDHVEIIVIVNSNPRPQAAFAFSELETAYPGLKVIFKPAEFNWGEINNAGVRDHATGNIIVFLNDDMVCLVDGWDTRLVGQLTRPDVGVVGGRLLYPNGTIQHAGITFCGDGMTAHEAMGDLPDDGLYLDRTLLVHKVGAVTGAFLCCRRQFFDELGGFDAERYAITSSDADFCVRARNAGKAILYDPFLTWIHFESITRGLDSGDDKKHWRAEEEHERWRRKFPKVELVDPSLNPHLTGSTPPFHSFHRMTLAGIGTWLEGSAKTWRTMPRP